MTDVATAEKLELVRRFWEFFEREPITVQRLDRATVDQLLDEFYAPDAVFDLTGIPNWPESPLWKGHDGIRRFWETWFSQWDEVRWELERIEPAGDCILSVAVQRGTGSLSRTPVEWRLFYVSTIRGSKVTRVRFFSNPDEATRAARAAC